VERIEQRVLAAAARDPATTDHREIASRLAKERPSKA
jgi:hypothetical protein